jgi:hypothetical protein
VTRLADAVDSGDRGSIAAARLELHGAIAPAHGPVTIAVDVTDAVGPIVVASVEGVASLTAVRSTAARAVRRRLTIGRQAAAAAAVGIVDDMVRHGGLVRDGSEIRLPGTVAAGAESDLDLAVAMDRLERALAVAAPPGLVEAARSVGCPPEGIRALERAARIEILEPDLAYAASTYRALASRALAMAVLEPLTPAAFRDATGTSRKYVMAILTDLDRRGILRRTDAGHVPGPRAPSAGDR